MLYVRRLMTAKSEMERLPVEVGTISQIAEGLNFELHLMTQNAAPISR